jgi:hypothetical protein
MKARLAVLAIAVLVTTGCGADGGSTTTAQPTGEPSEGPAADVTVSPLVGVWARVTTCAELLKALKDAGMERYAAETVIGNGFVPSIRNPKDLDPSDPCKGSVPREHSHFFTDDGSFGSLDWNGDPVDDGTYELVDNDTFAISKEFPDPVTFHFEIEGDSIIFDPVIPKCRPKCFESLWSVTVAYPGKEWKRVD